MSRRQVQTAVVAAGITVAAAAGALTPAWESTRTDITARAPAEHPRYATQSRSREAVRAAHLRWTGDLTKDTAAEACERFSTTTWAAKLGVRPEPEAVARALATRYYETAKRNAASKGCLGTLHDR